MFRRDWRSVGKAVSDRMGRSRRLTLEELRCLRDYFGENLRYERIRIGALPARRLRRAVSPWGGSAFFPRAAFIEANPSRPLRLTQRRVRSAFVHEATHIWQRQHGDKVTLRALPLQLKYLMGRDVYAYARHAADPRSFLALFLQSNVEQQAKMVGDLVEAEYEGSDTRKWSAVLDYLRTRPMSL